MSKKRTTAAKVTAELNQHLDSPVSLIREKGIFQDDNAPIHASGLVQLWFDEHKDEAKHLPWFVQSPVLNIIEPLWSILERSIRSRYPRPASLPELGQYLHQDWYNIPLNII
ncbi:DDE_3 domain-containing protein [Trichonephila clavipes]|nr:DDE_3 domain-containing protein [Trichonephila clavipes]